MAFANVFGVVRVGALAQGVRNPDALLRRKSEILADVPRVGLAKTAALFYDSLHEQKSSGLGSWIPDEKNLSTASPSSGGPDNLATANPSLGGPVLISPRRVGSAAGAIIGR
jgi:hypothetical protein